VAYKTISLIIEDDTFLVGDLRTTVSWILLDQHVILYVEILNEKNRIDFNLVLCPNHNLERDIITEKHFIFKYRHHGQGTAIPK
jgi:hypothetical protein